MLRKLFKVSFICKLLNGLKYFKNSNMSNCGKVFIRCVSDEESIQISFKYLTGSSEASRSRLFNFARPKTEELEKALLRISASVTKVVNKKSAKKKKSETVDSGSNSVVNNLSQELINVELLDDNKEPIAGQEKNHQAWRRGSLLTVGKTRFSVELNAPTVVSLKLPTIIMSNFTIYPKVSLEFADERDSQITWFIQKTTQGQEKNKKAEKKSISESWTEVGRGRSLLPSNDMVGCHLKISCLPKSGEREGEEQSCLTKVPVTEGPMCPFEKRHKFTQKITDENCFRIVSYNILADLYADSNFTREVLHPYCPAKYLDFDYRKQLIVKEILGYNSDIICLQEVDRKVFVHDLEPVLREEGYEGVLKLKMGEVAEGCATFFRRSKFRLIDSYNIDLVEFLQSKDVTMRNLLEKVSTKSKLLAKLLDRKTILQVTLLQDVNEDGRHLLVATTHLYFHPEAANIRLIQSHICVRYLQKLLKDLRATKSIEPSLIYCGDFNASITTAVHEYLLGKSVPPSCHDWMSGGSDEFVQDLQISHDLEFTNSCGFPTYTNYVKGFNACLDYIYTSKLHGNDVIHMPLHEDVTAQFALPSQFFPSDHIAIGCDLIWPPGEM